MQYQLTLDHVDIVFLFTATFMVHFAFPEIDETESRSISRLQTKANAGEERAGTVHVETSGSALTPAWSWATCTALKFFEVLPMLNEFLQFVRKIVVVSFSAVSKPIFAIKCSCCSIFSALHDLRTSAHVHNLQKTNIILIFQKTRF